MTQANRWLLNILRWFDSEAGLDHIDSKSRKFNALRVIPFLLLHAACLLVLVVGVSPFALAFALAFFVVRMFAITAFYHRYFAHKTFRTSRFWQFLFALLGASAAQRGPLWWAAHHRHHHQHSDRSDDLHSPHHGGFWWSHIGWFTCDAGFVTDERRVRDWLRFPELRFINRFDALVPLTAALAIFGLGELLAATAPSLGTNGYQLLVWGFFVSTVVLFHATVSINSLAHVWGRRRFDTADDSRNNFFLALLTLGEGWHNNHHRWPQSARQGFRWYEIDLTYYALWLMARLGIIWDLKPVPEHIQQETRARDAKNGRGTCRQ
ncbi:MULTISPECIES: acyl-CoA desaturase [Marinobacter]|uniref:Acyl-CoA desaturase n=1 Tax=Marinobacter xestospongiae TaxID=994319 RepID=A0ABU3W011_9GAMM|nr:MULTISPECIES: acyl-CoA desaturase [Marinobacter]MDV2079879.1 acyl-CoA desaturase [Marinobacter xestospongiae]UDL07131.1 acyl-CoA desaturase [Marinobacter sp. CA1]